MRDLYVLKLSFKILYYNFAISARTLENLG